MNFNTNLSIDFLKSQPTVGELSKVVKEAQSSKVNKPRFLDTSNSDNTGDRFLGQKGNKHLSGSSLPSLPLRTFNYTKLNNARRNLEWQQAEKELGLIQL